jgi:NADH-quinone oxidoreductase subunit M
VLAAVGTVIAAVYLLRVLREVWHGPREQRWEGAAMGDATRHELVVTSPLVAATVLLGLLPWLLLDVTAPAVGLLLGSPAGAP